MSKKEKTFQPYGDLDSFLDTIERKVDLTETTLNKNEGRMSTGLLMLDLVLGGGLTAGWYTNFGMEQSCKSTGAMTVLMASLTQNVPIIYYCDYEGSSDSEYIENIMHRMGIQGNVTHVFGERDNHGNYIHKPRVRYRDPSVAEQFFDLLASLERKLPDKRYINGEWFYIYEDTKETRKVVGSNYDEKYLKTHGKLKVKAEDGSLQALIVVDSYPAMLPEKQDVDDPSGAMAVQARMFSEQLQRVKGKMRGKRIAVLGVNQLRTNPGARFGNPEYEPGGNALKLYSDVRLRWSSRALSGVPDHPAGKGQIEEEASVDIEEGTDTYRYINVKPHKNKLSSATGLDVFLRLWISDAEGKAHGFDPVYDTFCYLQTTGQITGTRKKKLFLKLAGNESKRPIGWLTFKKLVLGNKKQMKKIYKACKMKPVLLRKFCFKQIKSGQGFDLMYEQKKVKQEKEIEVDKED